MSSLQGPAGLATGAFLVSAGFAALLFLLPMAESFLFAYLFQSTEQGIKPVLGIVQYKMGREYLHLILLQFSQSHLDFFLRILPAKRHILLSSLDTHVHRW